MGNIRVLVGETITFYEAGQILTLDTESFSPYNLTGATERAEKEDWRVYAYIISADTQLHFLEAVDSPDYARVADQRTCFYILPKGLADTLGFPDEEYDDDGNELEV